MNKKQCSLGLLLLACCLSASVVQAEMIVTTHDGRVLRLPVNAGDVKKIEYSGGAPASGFVGGDNRSFQYIGCFTDRQERDMNGYTFQSGSMTTAQCVATCRDRGFAYAGTQFSTHCFCDNSYGRYGAASNCNMNCSGNRSEKCGGSWANSVYRVQ